MSAASAAAPLPTVVLGGYLGAGKTTLVNHLLREQAARGATGRRIAVLVNDFGEVNIDAALIEGADGGVLSLAGGCVC
jgi:G3E family GTPase